MKNLINSLMFLLFLSAISCTVVLDTEELIEPCQTDQDCQESFYCDSNEGTCLPGNRDGGVVDVGSSEEDSGTNTEDAG